MEEKYIAVYELRGANGLPGDDPLGLCEAESADLVRTLVRQIAPAI